ncbi:unnamed protein product [Hyaloperonospora brassicae]|uniref:Uncharacterized protein n=1 Tax=Hyaloperonospora brassicae TaxID=162125 RepID=A0AAV0UMN2_HYABA|nr:unnamed protein product [Hyaloperonospora brassicae]
MRDLQSMDTECRSNGDIDNLPFVEEALRYTSGRLAKSDNVCKTGTHEYIAPPCAKGKQHENESGDAYSFYQIANGTYVILHPLNVKCLLKEFSDQQQREEQGESPDDAHKTDVEAVWSEEVASLEPLRPTCYHLLPERINGRVLDIEHMVMDDEALKRYRFLSHLPRFCDFYICELDLTSQLSTSTLSAFHHELKKRSKQRKQKLKLQNATTPLSPIAKRGALAFSLEQEGTGWPSPYEQALVESLEEAALDDCSLSTAELESRTYALVVEEEQQQQSFERRTENFGLFPALGGAATSDARLSGTNPIGFGSPSAWGSASSSPLALARMPGKKKKGASKKGVALFSTTQRRSYR